LKQSSKYPIRNRIEGKALVLALVAVLAIGAGIFAGLYTSGSRGTDALTSSENEDAAATSADKRDYAAIQKKLASSTVFPDNFKSVPAFNLLQGVEQPITEAALNDQWTVMFFGFIHCPDVCPITLNTMNSVVAKISESSAPVPQVMFVSVDPVRDTADKVSQYAQYFNQDFIGVTGELTAITELTRKLGIVASYTASESNPNEYTVDHTASMLLIDPQGRVRAKLNAPHEVDSITTDYLSLISGLI